MYRLVNPITWSYEIRITNRQSRWDRMDESFTMKLTGSESELVTIYGEINCPTESNNANRYLTANAQMWVNLTNSEQLINSCCIFRTVRNSLIDCVLTVDWTASQLVNFLYWFCLTEYIIWNWKWCYLYCLTSVMQGNRLDESDWIPQQLF